MPTGPASAASTCVTTQLTRSVGLQVGDAAFDPDGDVVFVSLDDLVGENPDHGPEVFRYDVETGDTAQVTEGTLPSPGEWSGDGTTLLFGSNRDLVGGNGDRNGELFRFRVADGSIRQITDSVGGGFVAHWGVLPANFGPVSDRDGDHVYFGSTNSYPGGQPLDGVDGRWFSAWVTDVEAGSFHDMSDVAVLGQAALDGAGSLLVAPSTGGELTVYDLASETSSPVRAGATGGSPAFSDDGRVVAFISEADLVGENADGGTEAFASELGSGVITQLTHAASTADGRTIEAPLLDDVGANALVLSSADLDGANPFGDELLFLVDRRSGVATNVFAPEFEARFWPVDLSGDGQRVLFRGDPDPFGRNPDLNTELFVADCGSGSVVAEQWPDAVLARPGSASVTGDGVYGQHGAGETRLARRQRGTTAHYVVRLENDGSSAGAIRARGRRSGPVSVRYLDGDADVTSAVAAGTYETGVLAPGEAAEITAIVTVPGAARVGAVGTVTVRATPIRDEVVIHGRDDKVKLRVEVGS